MSVFSDHKIGAKQLLEVIPDALFSTLSSTTKVDYYAKVLHGKKDVLSFNVWDFRKRETKSTDIGRYI